MVYKIYGLYDTECLRYIGYTKNSLRERLVEHLYSPKKELRSNHRINWIKSMQILGKKITIKLLDTASSFEESQEKEIEWIAQTRREGADLINSTLGGGGMIGCKWTKTTHELKSIKVKQYLKTGELIAIHKSISDAAEIITGDRKNNSKISQACRGKRGRRTCFGFVWRYLKDTFNTYPIEGQWNITEAQRKAISLRQSTNNCMKGRTGAKHPNRSPVIQLDQDQNIVEEFTSIAEAIIKTGLNGISVAAQRGHKRGGFYWKYQVKI